MLNEIGSWRRHENSVTFVGGRQQREEGPARQFSVLADSSKRYAVREDRSIGRPYLILASSVKVKSPYRRRMLAGFSALIWRA